MKKLITLFTFISSSLSFANPECDYHFSLSNATVQVRNTSQVIQQNMTVNRGQNSPNGRCQLYRVFYSKGGANNYQRRAINSSGQTFFYNLHQNINQAGILKDFGDAVTFSEFIQGEAPDKLTNYSKSFFISVPGLGAEAQRSGFYSDTVQVSIYGYNENSGKYLFEETDNFTVIFHVPKQVQVSLVQEGGTFDPSSTSKVLDFGNLSKNQTKGADLRVLSNGPYQVKMSSQNNGKLMLPKGEKIGYALKVNGNSTGLEGSASTPVPIGRGDVTPSSGDRYNLRFTISEETGEKSAGLYQDVLTITAIAN